MTERKLDALIADARARAEGTVVWDDAAISEDLTTLADALAAYRDLASDEQVRAEQRDSTAVTYKKPEHGWTCFHCGATFRSYTLARNHFGEKPDEVVRLNDALAAYRTREQQARALVEEWLARSPVAAGDDPKVMHGSLADERRRARAHERAQLARELAAIYAKEAAS